MLLAMIFIITGVFIILYGNSEYYKDYVEKHNFEEREEILSTIRNMVAYIFIGLGVLAIFSDILLKIKG